MVKSGPGPIGRPLLFPGYSRFTVGPCGFPLPQAGLYPGLRPVLTVSHLSAPFPVSLLGKNVHHFLAESQELTKRLKDTRLAIDFAQKCKTGRF